MPKDQIKAELGLTEDRRNRNIETIRQPGGRGAMARNKAHVRSDEIADKVRLLRSLGNNLEVIAFACGVSSDTIRRHYQPELDTGAISANARVGAAIFQSAIGERDECPKCAGEREVDGETCPKCNGTGEGKAWRREPNTTAQIWWSKNRMEWTDQQRIEHTGAGGGPIITEQRTSGDRIRDRLSNIQKRLEGSAANDKQARK